ncbi:MAG: hypothetical protein CMP23_11745 [Rickettsiales bacterium]|nr:hypothetical protein [Rickettsiales bacterium]
MGAKAARLGELLRLGWPVPRGFVISPSALSDLVAQQGSLQILERAHRALTSGDGARALRAGLEAGDCLRELTLSATFRASLEAQCSALLEGPEIEGASVSGLPSLAVRSSALVEDGSQQSHAGQFSSVLNLRSVEAVFDAVTEVWASWFSERAIAYRQRWLQDQQAGVLSLAAVPAMAVLVQRMITPRCSGVLFTVHPVRGTRDELCLEAGPGLGEELAQGRLLPDLFVVRRPLDASSRFSISERSVARKERALRASIEHEGKLQFEPLPAAARRQPCLDDGEIIALCRLAVDLEQHCGAAVDLEWALDSAGRIFLLQVRPVTALAGSGPVRSHDARPLRARPLLWTQRFSGERWTEGATPLGWSIVQPALHHFTYWEVASERWLEGSEPSRLILGRPYFNLTIFRHLAFRLPGGAPPQFLLEMFPPDEQRELQEQAPLLPNLGLVVSVLGQMVRERRWERYRFNPRTNCADWEEFQPRFEAQIADLSVDFLEIGPGLKVLEVARQLMVDYLSIHLLSLLYAHLSYEGLGILLRSWGGLGGEALRAALVSQPADNETLRCNAALWRLAWQAQQLEEVRARLLREPLPSLSELEGCEGGTQFVTAFAEFLQAFGHRSSASWEIFASRWEDSPELPLQMIAGYLRGGLPVDPSLAERQRSEEREQAERLVRTRMGRTALRRLLPWRQQLFDRLLVLSRRYMALRENQRFSFDRLLLRMKRVLERLGALLERSGALGSGADIVFLEIDEVLELHEGRLAPDLASQRIEQRRQRFNRDLLAVHPDFLSGEEAVPVPLGHGAAGGDVLVGLGISSGRLRGRVRVLSRLEDMAALQPGEILVCRAADPGWTPLFLTAGALVFELGSVLSHGAVVAREYKLPAVVNVQGACSLLQDGMEVTVDGDRGTVTLHRALKGPMLRDELC